MPATEPMAELDQRFSSGGAAPRPWSEVQSVLEQSEIFWLSTVRREGRPHVTPLPAIWLEDALYFCTGAAEQKGVNLSRSSHCALTTGNNKWKSGLDVVIEGDTKRVTDGELLRHLARAWESKYMGDWHFEVANGAFHHEGGEAFVFEVVPEKVLAFAKGDFAQTRFRLTSGST